MRKKIISAPVFPLIIDTNFPKIVTDFQEKYDRIGDMLDAHPAILDAVHDDIASMESENGRESSFSSEQFLRILVVKCIEGLSFRDAIIRVADSSILRNFVRIFSGEIMNFTALDTASKKISGQTWETINTILAKSMIASQKITGEKQRVDSTVSETNVHYPTDASLLWDSYRVGARLIDQCRKADRRLDLGDRFHNKKVKRSYTFVATHSSRKNPATKRDVGHHMKHLLEQVERVSRIGWAIVECSKAVDLDIAAFFIVEELKRMLGLIDHVYAQSLRAFNGETVPASERIFSIFEPHTELLMRGKAHKPHEFGHMVTIGQSGQKFITFYKVEEKSRHDIVLGDEAKEAHKKLFGAYPKKYTADKNYYGGPEHTEKWESKIDEYSVGKKGNRTAQETLREHDDWFKLLQAFRAGCEGSISVLKRVFGLRRCLNRTFKSFAASIGCLVFCHNLVVASRL
jgi:IS5 family transposase